LIFPTHSRISEQRGYFSFLFLIFSLSEHSYRVGRKRKVWVGREERERGWRNEGCVFVCVCACVKGQREIKQAHHLAEDFSCASLKRETIGPQCMKSVKLALVFGRQAHGRNSQEAKDCLNCTAKCRPFVHGQKWTIGAQYSGVCGCCTTGRTIRLINFLGQARQRRICFVAPVAPVAGG
jgi:hypothetical protein